MARAKIASCADSIVLTGDEPQMPVEPLPQVLQQLVFAATSLLLWTCLQVSSEGKRSSISVPFPTRYLAQLVIG